MDTSLFKKQFIVEKPKRERDLFGEALEAWFGTKAVYGVYKKFGRGRTERVFTEMQKVEDKNWRNFMQRIHHD